MAIDDFDQGGIILKLANSLLGKRPAKVFAWLFLIIIVTIGGLWTITFMIDRLDMLSQRFDVSIVPTNISVISLSSFLSSLAGIVLGVVALAGIFFAFLFPMFLAVRLAIGSVRMERVNSLLETVKENLRKAELDASPQDAAVLRDAIQKIDKAQSSHSWIERLKSLIESPLRRKRI